jgi:soluble lytic murein transglycosylase-like protein
MSSSLSAQYFFPRISNAILSYLHADLAVLGVALSIILAAGFASSTDPIRTIAAAFPAVALDAPLPQRNVESARPRLSSAMTAAMDSVAQRYRVSPLALQPVFEVAQAVARERNLDPLLIVAVISVESGFNPFAQSAMGAQGLMQIIPRFHQDKLPRASDKSAFLDPLVNVQMGARILHEAIRRQGGLTQGLQYYAGASDDPEQTYANKVIAEKQRLEQATRRREAASA